MKIECAYDKLVPLSELRQHPKNRNKHPANQIERLAKVLKYQGWRKPITVSNRSGFITAGHGRLEAALKNGWKEVPVDYQDYESEEQEYADLTADNALASWAELDLSGINLDIGDLGPDFDIELLGLQEFTVEPADKLDEMTKTLQDDMNKKFILEITFPNDMEMMDIHDDLISRGYIVKIRDK